MKTSWFISCALSLVAFVNGYPVLENVTQVLKDPRAGKPIKGKHYPIGPGTDKGLYNKDFFEGDIILPKSLGKDYGAPVSNDNLMRVTGLLAAAKNIDPLTARC